MASSASRLLFGIVVSTFLATSMSAQATRTWISGVGDDANPCSRTAPCKTFAGAMTKTAAGGEISVLDPGGYGAVTITKAITIDGGGVASILGAGTNGVSVIAGVNDVVTLRNLSINGVRQSGFAGTNGIRIVSAAAVHIESSDIFNFGQRGLSIETSAANVRVFVRDTTITANNEGIGSFPTGGNVLLTLENAHVDGNSTHGINLKELTTASLSDSTMNQNGIAGLIPWLSTVNVSLTRCDLSSNQTGIYAGYLGGAPTVRLTDSMVTGNTINGVHLNGGIVRGFRSNMIDGNGGNNFLNAFGDLQ